MKATKRGLNNAVFGNNIYIKLSKRDLLVDNVSLVVPNLVIKLYNII